jgi:hypothetical protein
MQHIENPCSHDAIPCNMMGTHATTMGAQAIFLAALLASVFKSMNTPSKCALLSHCSLQINTRRT